MRGERSMSGSRSLIHPPKLHPSLLMVLAWRWWTGLPLGGAEPGEAALRRRAKRAAWRHGTVLAVLLAAVDVLTDPAGLVVAVTTAALSAAWLGFLWWRQRPHSRGYLRPLYDRWRSLGVPLEDGPDRHLVVPEDRQSALIRLPHSWDAPHGVLELAERATSLTLGWGDTPSVSRHLSGRHRYVELTPPPLPPPETALLSHPKVMAAIKSSAQWEIVLGLGRAGVVEKFKMIGENARPHGLANGPTTEAGKSSTARLIVAQWLRHGGMAVILDPAWLSHPWASTFRDGNLPNAIVVRTIEDIAAMLVWLQETMDDRLRVALSGQRRSGFVEADLGVKILVTLEEMNSLLIDLKDYPEAIEALLKLVCRGRHMGIHALCLSQRAEARTLAGKHGGQVREQLGWKLLGRGTSPATLKFLAEGLPYPPGGISGPEGRYGAVIGRKYFDVQIAYATNEECWDLAVSGTVAALPHNLPEFMGSDLIGVTDTTSGYVFPAWRPGTAVSVTPSEPPEPLASVTEYAALRDLPRPQLHTRRQRWRNKGWPEVAGHDNRNQGAELFVIRELDEHLRERGVLQ